MVSKFTEKDLAKMEAKAELLVYKTFQSQNAQLGLPTLSHEQERQILLGNERCSPLIWNFFEKAGPSVKQRLFTQTVFTAILSESEIDRYELVCNNLAVFLEALAEHGQKEKMAHQSFKFNKEMSVEAMRLFFDHFARHDYFGFSSSAYQQWSSSLRLGIYANPERILNGAGSLNYPDLNVREETGPTYGGTWTNPSPRLSALRSYLETIYQLRVKVQLLDLLIRNREHAGTNPNISMGQWERFINSTRSRLNSKFGSQKGTELFRRMFGSDNPTAPTSQQDFNQVQNEVLDKISQAILAEQLGQDWAPQPPQPTDGFHRDYAQEQQEREERERQNRQRKEKENLNWANINPTFNNNPQLVKQWTDKGFTYQQTKEWIDIGIKPPESEFTAYLRDQKSLTPEQMLNSGNKEQLQAEFQEWKKQPQPKPEAPKEEKKRDKSPSRQAAEDKVKGKTENIPPPVETSFNSSALNDALNKLKGSLAQDSKDQGHDKPFTPSPGLGMPLNSIMKEDALKLPWLAMGFNLRQSGSCPYWHVHDPATFASVSHGEGDFVTLLLKLVKMDTESGYSQVLHNFFKCLGGDDKKGYERLIKDEETEKEQLLITDERKDDKLANKYGWDSYPWDRNGTIDIGVPGVEQKSWRFTRWTRTYDKAFDFENDNHIIGKLKKRGLLGGFEIFGNGRVAKWGNGPKKSILWITNQVKYPYHKNQDWAGDDPNTINQNNNFSHYLLFTNLSTETINTELINNKTPALNAKSLTDLISKIGSKGRIETICIGPDVLNLKETLTPDQKDKAKDETPDSRDKNKQEVKDEDLTDMGIDRDQFNRLNAPFLDKAEVANIIKQISQNVKPEKMSQMLNRMFEHLQPETREKMFNQMVDNNPVFTDQEKETLKSTWKEAKTKEGKKKVWETLTSHSAQREAHAKKTQEQKDKIFEEQVNKNPAYGPPGVDTQERRDRFAEYTKADETKKADMQKEENEKFTTGENANQWADYFQSNATFEAGGGDDTINCEGDDYNSQFSFTESLKSINKLKDIINMKPEGMQEGMAANKPYWQVIFAHPLTYIFLFIGMIMAVLASVTRKK